MVKRWLTVEELSGYLGLSSRTIYNAIAPKSKAPFPIKPKRFGRHVLFDLREVDAHLESQ
jgi:excisionase family DNA binding protein